MVARPSHYDRHQLQRLLDDPSNAAGSEEVTRHIETCQACRRELETLAAGDAWWQDARQLLGEDETAYALQDNTVSSRLRPDEFDTTPDEMVLEFLDPSDNPAMLGRVGQYEILEVIGRGSMGVVLRGYDAQLNRYVAVKLLAPHYAFSAAARKRFAREAKAAAAVVHQHVVAIHAVDASGKLPYLVMPYVECETLQQRIDRLGPLESKEILRIGMQAAQGLAAAHAQGLVHRDVKPANILVEKSVERALLTDFGLARAMDDASLTRSGVIAGTPQYMSPEQAKGEPVDHRADLFSLGSVLYAMSAGRPPFRAETAMGILRRICDIEPRRLQEINPDVPPWLCRIIDKLLAKNPDERFQSAAEVGQLLENCLAHVQHPTAVPLPESLRQQERETPRARRKVAFLLAGTAAALLLAAVGFFTPWNGTPPPPDESLSDVADSVVLPAESLDDDRLAADGLPWHNEIDSQIDEIDRDLRSLQWNIESEFVPETGPPPGITEE